jgi:hypothetical protein
LKAILVVFALFISVNKLVSQNLIVNPGFESDTFTCNSGEIFFGTWQTQTSGSGVCGIFYNKALKSKVFRISGEGTLKTSKKNLIHVLPNTIYKLSFQSSKPIDNAPENWLGLEVNWQFMDENKQPLRLETGNTIQPGKSNEQWQQQDIHVTSPAKAAYLQLIFNLPQEPVHSNAKMYEIDKLSLFKLPETENRIKIISAPGLIRPGKKEQLRFKYTAINDDSVMISLLNKGNVLVTQKIPITSGRAFPEVSIPIPIDLSNSDSYQWKVSFADVSNVKSNISVNENPELNDTIKPDNINLVYGGRIDNSNPGQPVFHWTGSYVNMRFQGTSVTGMFTNQCDEDADLIVVIDGDEKHHLTKIKLPAHSVNTPITLVSGLPNGNYTLTLIKNIETHVFFEFHGFILEKGKGILAPQLQTGKKIEFYGNSVTTGGCPDVKVGCTENVSSDRDYENNIYRSFGAFTGRALQADYRMISKGATGIAKSFVFNYAAAAYFNLLKYDVYNPADMSKSSKWNFGKWQADIVVAAYGQNDSGNGTTHDEFVASYKKYLKLLRDAYPNAYILCELGEMEGGMIYKQALQHTIEKYKAESNDSKVSFVILYSDGKLHGSHPKYEQHFNMAYGSDFHKGLVQEILEKTEGYDLPVGK